jgi:hypothetical protein
MTDPSQQCPPAWREYNTSGVRACGRPVTNGTDGSRPASFYTVDQQYNRVCGRALGYQVGTPDSFNAALTIDQGYTDGLSITHGQPRQHIWSYAAGHSQESATHSVGNCPCSPEAGSAAQPWIGSNYYCESGNPNNNSFPLTVVYTNDRLWDGQQCEGTCCSGGKSPPWFSVQLPTLTTDRIEVRICADQPTTDEDILVELLEIYVQ